MQLPKHMPYTVLALDPGTTHMGVSISRVWQTGPGELCPRLTVDTAYTLDLSKIRDYHSLDSDLYVDRRYRLLQIASFIEDVIGEIDVVAVEAPFFFFKKPQAFAALIEAMTCIEYNILRCRPNLPLVKIEPTLVKKLVKAKDYKSKDAVTAAVGELFGSRDDLQCDVELSRLDEHAIDAVAVAIAYYHRHEIFLNTEFELA